MAPEAPAVRVTFVDGEAWMHAGDLIAWARANDTPAGRELAAKVAEMAEYPRRGR